MSARDAIILAAGAGSRLRGAIAGRPKGSIEIAGEALVARSVRLLRAAGIDRVTIVAGYCADWYRQFAASRNDVRIAVNDAFATTGSMASLAIGIAHTSDADVLVLESDIAYESRALDSIVAHDAPDAVLLSGPTGAGDEVWVSAPAARLEAMSKRREDLTHVTGEFVGIVALSSDAAAEMRRIFDRFAAQRGHGRMDYETGALVELARRRPVAAVLIDDLVWGEIDDERHYARVAQLRLDEPPAATRGRRQG